jgi:hypothetical protein
MSRENNYRKVPYSIVPTESVNNVIEPQLNYSKSYESLLKNPVEYKVNYANKQQQLPNDKSSNLPNLWDLVIHDMEERDKFGISKYNTSLKPHNGRDALLDAYQEALDLCVYLRQALYERDNQPF